MFNTDGAKNQVDEEKDDNRLCICICIYRWIDRFIDGWVLLSYVWMCQTTRYIIEMDIYMYMDNVMYGFM